MSRIRPAKFAHVVYRTRRFKKMLNWYETVFDAKVRFQNPAPAFLTDDDEHHRFALANLAVLQPGGHKADRRGVIGVDHLAYTYESLPALFENYAYLNELGIRPYWCVHHGFTRSMYCADPGGNQMEFQVACYDSNEGATAYMHGPHFCANPIGVEYDPDDWLAQLHSGAPPSNFLVRRIDEPQSPIRGSIAN